MNYYTADWHLFHQGIIGMCERPFADVEEMNETIIARARERLTAKDDLWIIGDFTYAKGDEQRAAAASLLKRVPGRKHLVRGNHDKNWVSDLPWHSVHDARIEIKDSGRRVILDHYPMVTWPGSRHGSLQLFGHVHHNWRGHRNSVNVGVDLWDFYPVTLEEASLRGAELPCMQEFFECEPGLKGTQHWT